MKKAILPIAAALIVCFTPMLAPSVHAQQSSEVFAPLKEYDTFDKMVARYGLPLLVVTEKRPDGGTRYRSVFNSAIMIEDYKLEATDSMVTVLFNKEKKALLILPGDYSEAFIPDTKN